MTSSEPYLQTSTEVIERIRSGELAVEQYARSLLSRIEARDGVVKAWAFLDPDLVMKEAKRLDEIPVAERGALHGMAVAVKDIIYTKDMPTRYNSPLYQGDWPKVDAASVQVLRHAGALIFGKTTTTEFAATRQGPPTTNPHDPSRTPGGSSSGSGAAVGDFQVPIGLGSQTGGSTIWPGSFNGVYAFKPTWNVISREGQKIYSGILDTLGLYSRSVADLVLLADVFKLDAAPESEGFQINDAKIGVCKTMVWSKAGPGLVAAMNKAVELLKAHGAEVEEVSLPSEFNDLPEWQQTVMTTDGRSAFLPEYYAGKDQLADFLVKQVDNAAGVSRAKQLEAFDGIATARPVVDRILAKYDAVLAPSVPDEAPEGQSNTGSAIFNGMWTALHTPVLNIPGFQGQHGMPIGLSLVAPRYKDRHLLIVGEQVGRIFEAEGGWKPKNM